MIEIDLVPVLGCVALGARPGIVPGGRVVTGVTVVIAAMIKGNAGPPPGFMAVRTLILVMICISAVAIAAAEYLGMFGSAIPIFPK